MLCWRGDNGKAAYLSTCHQVPSSSDDRDRILLNGGGSSIHGKANVFQEDRVQRRAGERKDRLRHTSTSRLNRDVVVFLEVDASVLLRRVISVAIKLLLHAHVAPANDVLSVFPGTIAKSLTRSGLRPILGRLGTSPVVVDRGRGMRAGGAVEGARASIVSAAGLESATGGRGKIVGGFSPVSVRCQRDEPLKERYGGNCDLRGTRRRGSSPLLAPEVGRYVGRSSETERLC